MTQQDNPITWDDATLLAWKICRDMVTEGKSPDGTRSEELGDWEPAVQELYNAYEIDGHEGVKKVASVIPEIVKLLSSDPEPIAEKTPYGIQDGRLSLKKPVKEGYIWVPIADFTARIVEEISTEDVERIYRLQGQAVRGGSFTVEIDARDFTDNRKLKAAISAAVGAQDPIRARMIEHLGPAIQHHTTNSIEKRLRYTSTGWKENGRFIIPGREPQGTEIVLDPHIPYSLENVGDLDEGLKGLSALMAVVPCLAPVVIAFILGAPLADLAGWRNNRYAAYIIGRTGTLKTSFAQAALSIYGPDTMSNTHLIKFGGATPNAIMQIATLAHDMPLLIDNYKPNTGYGARGLINLIQILMEGREKDRLNRASVLKTPRPIYTWPIFTGEDIPDSDAATIARGLVIPFPWQGGQVPSSLTTAQNAAIECHLAAVGKAWIEWLESPEGKQKVKKASKRFQPMRQEWTDKLHKLNPDMQNKRRIASNLACNELTWWVAGQCPAIASVIDQYGEAHTEGINRIAEDMSNRTAESLEAHRFLEAIRELLASTSVTLAPQNSDPYSQTGIGWEDGEGGAYILVDITLSLVKDLLGRDALGDISKRTLYDQLDTLGVLASTGSKVKTVQRRLGKDKKVVRVLHLRADALVEPYKE